MQLSDTHFLEPGEPPEGGFAYDTSDAFSAVLQRIQEHGEPDLVAVTGDVADHGRSAQYRIAADAFSRFEAPVNVCPGNHDADAALTASITRPDVSTSQVINVDNWSLLFADSNAGVMIPDSNGRPIDPEYEQRLHNNGTLGAAHAAWIVDMCETSDADHVFVFLHHPPRGGTAWSNDDTYADEWRGVLAATDKIRGFGAGHTHVPTTDALDGIPIFICPAFKNNFDMDASTFLPPGYRTYEFHADGTVDSTVELIDDDRWPRHPMPRSVVALLRGELSFEEFDEIVARKRKASEGR